MEILHIRLYNYYVLGGIVFHLQNYQSDFNEIWY